MRRSKKKGIKSNVIMPPIIELTREELKTQLEKLHEGAPLSDEAAALEAEENRAMIAAAEQLPPDEFMRGRISKVAGTEEFDAAGVKETVTTYKVILLDGSEKGKEVDVRTSDLDASRRKLTTLEKGEKINTSWAEALHQVNSADAQELWKATQMLMASQKSLMVWPEGQATDPAADGLFWPRVAIVLSTLAWSWGVMVSRNARVTPDGRFMVFESEATNLVPGIAEPMPHVYLRDLITGVVEIVGYCVVDDVGRMVNPLLVKGQIHGGVVQGLGQALFEHLAYDDGGQLLSGSFMDYALPRADVVPPVHFDMHNSPCTTNPLGVKGAGEAGAIGAPPAVINAIVDAIYPETGLKHVDMPATAHALWQAIQSARGGTKVAAE